MFGTVRDLANLADRADIAGRAASFALSGSSYEASQIALAAHSDRSSDSVRVNRPADRGWYLRRNLPSPWAGPTHASTSRYRSSLAGNFPAPITGSACRRH